WTIRRAQPDLVFSPDLCFLLVNQLELIRALSLHPGSVTGVIGVAEASIALFPSQRTVVSRHSHIAELIPAITQGMVPPDHKLSVFKRDHLIVDQNLSVASTK